MSNFVKKFALAALVSAAAFFSAGAQDVYKKGYAGNVEAGMFMGNSLYASVSTVHGFTGGKGFFIGLGVKFDAAMMDVSGMPAFFEAHDRPYSGNNYAAAFLAAKLGFTKPEAKFKIGLDLKAGPSYDLALKSLGAFCRPAVNLGIGSFGISAGVDLGAFNCLVSEFVDSDTKMYIEYCPYLGLSFNF